MNKLHVIRALALAGMVVLGSGQAAVETPVVVTYSSPDMDKTPRGGIQFHGPFNRETLYVTAAKLPPHAFIDVSFELFLIRSWDGSVVVVSPDKKPQPLGPDYFRLALYKGPTLLYTTFSNMPAIPGFRQESRMQNYPSQVPGDRFVAGTGASFQNTLGYNFPDTGPSELTRMDSTYRIHFIMPHKETEAVLELSGINLQDMHDENWGIGEVEIKPLAAGDVKKPGEAAIAGAFEVSMSTEGKDLPGAFQTLINGMDDTVAWMEKNVTPATVSREKVMALIDDLEAGDEKLAARDAAHMALVDLGIAAEAALRDARKSTVGEQRLRIDWVLATLNVSETPLEARRAAFAARVLEIIGTEKALALREKLTLK